MSTSSSAAASRIEVAWYACSAANASIHFCRNRPVITAVPAAVAASIIIRAMSDMS